MLQSIAQENKKDNQQESKWIAQKSENQLPWTADWWETSANREKKQQEVIDSTTDTDSEKYIKLQPPPAPLFPSVGVMSTAFIL